MKLRGRLLKTAFNLLLLVPVLLEFSPAFAQVRGPGYGNLPHPGHLPPPLRQWKRLPPPQLKKQRLPRPVPRHNDPIDTEAAKWVGDASEGLDCERLGETLRRLSQRAATTKGTPREPRKLKPFQSEVFWERIWNHLSDTYRSCDVDCFEDGYAVGQISGQAYCGISVALEGLQAPGYRAQGPLPVCENSIFIGCLNGFKDTMKSDVSCRPYFTGRYTTVAKQFQSQDCHID